MLTRPWSRVAAVVVAAGALACSQQGPAQSAITAAEAALTATPADAQVYAADLYTAITGKITEAKTAFEAKDYKTALASAQEASTRVGEFGAAIETKKTELNTAWGTLSQEMPTAVTALDNRITELSRMRRLPAGMTTATLNSAKTGVAEVKQLWTDATAAFDDGNLMDAVTNANSCKTRIGELKSALGMATS
jgi:hypothetical protein